MFGFDDMRAALGHMTYRPGWGLSLEHGRWEGPELHVRVTVEDSYHPGSDVDLDIRTYVPPLPDQRAFDEWLCWRLIRIESHECREWLKRDGHPIFNPHAETL